MYGYEHVRTAKGDLHMVELCTAAILANPAAQPLVETVYNSTLHDDPRAPIVATACYLVLVTCAPECT